MDEWTHPGQVLARKRRLREHQVRYRAYGLGMKAYKRSGRWSLVQVDCHDVGFIRASITLDQLERDLENLEARSTEGNGGGMD